jgi:hypothetical protein
MASLINSHCNRFHLDSFFENSHDLAFDNRRRNTDNSAKIESYTPIVLKKTCFDDHSKKYSL